MDDAVGKIRPGMRVVDAAGEDVGTVESLKMGDPEATTEIGQAAGTEQTLVGDLAEAFTGAEPRIPPELAQRMLRLGYIKVDGKGLFGRDFYAASDRIDRVEGETVYLTVGREMLVEKS